jgi:hypothetical protein
LTTGPRISAIKPGCEWRSGLLVDECYTDLMQWYGRPFHQEGVGGEGKAIIDRRLVIVKYVSRKSKSREAGVKIYTMAMIYMQLLAVNRGPHSRIDAHYSSQLQMPRKPQRQSVLTVQSTPPSRPSICSEDALHVDWPHLDKLQTKQSVYTVRSGNQQDDCITHAI